VATYSLPCDVSLWKMVLEAGEGFKPMDAKEQEKAVEHAKRAGFRPLFPT
jgi:hypothetical protein